MGRFRHHPEVVSTELEEGAVLLHMETRTYYSLNDTALGVWRLADTAETVETIAGALQQAFDVGADQALESAATCLRQLESEHLIVPAADPAGGATPVSLAAPIASPDGSRRPFAEPVLIKHDEPLHEIPMTPFDPQLPLAE